ncbi:hypothetical protein IMCC20628_01837 [Hoeflea sp. IMCC20628]|uniref:hypothetical protein n=1 Tax=Hoeflea sp. IMCC20628 TaxID=1620421 RepID=UPI00063AB931|nr:hypothetical protein [Hoeflea sp. IMCC20628]AKI00544.1 hypothetical protein IMCC20628_01837 [Hoeflea sp. IMCC20628]
MTATPDQERSEHAHDIIDLAVLDLRDLGYTGAAPHRMLAWTAFEAIRAESGASEAVADLTRLRGMLDKHLEDLAAGVPQ